MNFLAHTLLAFEDPELLVGQFCGDFVRGRDLSRFPDRVADGIRLHRHVDAFTDVHPAVLDGKKAFVDRRRFAGIILDVWFDHCLARDWGRFSPLSLQDHARWVFTVLEEFELLMPEPARRFAGYLQREAVFDAYRSPDAAVSALSRLSRRSPALFPLAIGKSQLLQNRVQMDAAFEGLWEALLQSAKRFSDNTGMADEH